MKYSNPIEPWKKTYNEVCIAMRLYLNRETNESVSKAHTTSKIVSVAALFSYPN